MTEKKHYFGKLIGTRPTWPGDMTSAEQGVMGEHFQYLSKLVEEGKVLMAGPCFEEPPFGLVILCCENESETKALLEADPSALERLHRVQCAEFHLSLWSEKKD